MLNLLCFQRLIFDIFNGLQGVVIFFVFVWRPYVLARIISLLFGENYAKNKFPRVYHPQATFYEGNEQLNFDLTVVKDGEDIDKM